MTEFDDPPNYYDEVDDITSGIDETSLQAPAEDDDDQDTLIIGLDFGTTYSGVAYAFSTKPDKIYTIEEWPGAKGRKFVKCPTLIKYTGNNEFLWGYELDRTTGDRIEAIKLLLDPDQPKPLYVPAINTEAELKKLGKPAESVATDYISAIFQHALRKIESKFMREYISMLKKRYVLSVPAVWSDKAKDATLRAARNAGLSSVKLIKEPEAAALFTLNQVRDTGLSVGDALVLCDAGGGTVDLISYEILKLAPLELREVSNSTGGLAGSLMLNKRFEEWIKDVVGEQAYITLRESDAYRRAMKDFDEKIKPGFRSRDDRDEFITFPKAKLVDNPAKGLELDTITVKGTSLYTIFDPVFREIDKLVREQVTSVQLNRLKAGNTKGDKIKAIFLVGGFGSSAYLHEAISTAYPDIQVIQPNEAQAAIVRGAVMSQLSTEAKVTISHAAKHYGVSAWSHYDEQRDIGQEKQWYKHEGVFKVSTMTWYIHKGDDLHRSRKIEFPYYRTFGTAPTGDMLRFKETLLSCALDTAPEHPISGVLTDHVTLTTDLTSIPRERIKKKSRKDNGKTVEWYELHYKIMVSIESGPMIFSVVCGDQEVGKVGTEY